MNDITTTIYEGSGVTENITGTQPLPQISNARGAFEIILLVAVALGMFGIGCGVEPKRLIKHYKKPTGAIIGIVSQFIIMPLISLVFVQILQMSDARSLTLLILGSCPGGTISNVMVVWVNGDVDLSVSMTTASSVLAFAVMPLLLLIYSSAYPNSLQVPFEAIGINLALVLVPIAVGMLFRWKFKKAAKILLRILSAIVLICSIVYAVLALITYSGFLQVSTGQIISGLFIPIIGMFLGYGLSTTLGLAFKRLRLEHFQRRTIAIETGIQNVQVASGIIVLSDFSIIEEGQVILHPFLYLVGQMIWLVLIISTYQIYKRLHPNEETDDGIDDKGQEASGSKYEMKNASYTNDSFEKSEKSPQGTYTQFSKI